MIRGSGWSGCNWLSRTGLKWARSTALRRIPPKDFFDEVGLSTAILLRNFFQLAGSVTAIARAVVALTSEAFNLVCSVVTAQALRLRSRVAASCLAKSAT